MVEDKYIRTSVYRKMWTKENKRRNIDCYNNANGQDNMDFTFIIGRKGDKFETQMRQCRRLGDVDHPYLFTYAHESIMYG